MKKDIEKYMQENVSYKFIEDVLGRLDVAEINISVVPSIVKSVNNLVKHLKNKKDLTSSDVDFLIQKSELSLKKEILKSIKNVDENAIYTHIANTAKKLEDKVDNIKFPTPQEMKSYDKDISTLRKALAKLEPLIGKEFDSSELEASLLEKLQKNIKSTTKSVYITTAGTTIENVTGLQDALNAKQGALTLTTTGSSGAATLIGDTLNIPQYSGGGGGGTWGSITGTLSAQTDLQTALDAKQSTTLTNGSILIGNASNVATANAVSGDVIISNTGVTTITNNAVTNAKVATGIDATKLADGTVSNAELQYINSLTSNAQTQLDSKQTLDTTLTALAAYNTNGSIHQTAADTFVGRTLTGSTGITVTNGNGVSGNPTVAIDATVATLSNTQALTNKNLTGVGNTFPTFNQSTTGSAATLTTGRTIGITGDLTYTSPSFNGSANVTAAGTLATVNSNVGAFGSATQASTFTVNAKGLTTAAGNVTITPAVGSITGLGTGVATFLATPSSANLAATVTDETGTGALVFGTSPTLVTPALGTPTALVGTNITGTATGLTSGITNALKSATTTINVSSATAPSSGQILTATSSTSATWQTPAGGGSADVQIFTSSGTWTKPSGKTFTQILLVGAGAAGGSGRRGAAGTVRTGGGGGAAGQLIVAEFPTSVLSATESVSIGAAGIGGAAITVNDTNGNAGNYGGISSFGNWAKTSTPNPANGGTTTSATGGTVVPSFALFVTSSKWQNSDSGNGANSENTGGVGATSANSFGNSPTGGGAGGGISAANVANNGGAGGQVGLYGASNLNRGGGSGGIVDTTAPTVGENVTANVPSGGAGGGGGAASITTAAQAGSNGGTYGAGGGGGGASLNGNNSGAGGNGGAGIVIIISW